MASNIDPKREARKEEKRREALKQLIDGKMEEYGVTKKTLYSAMGIFGCLFLTVAMSITGMGFDPAVFLTWNYWTRMIIQFAISIFAMITGRQIGDDTQRNKPGCQYRRELSKYSAQYARIDSGGMFDHFEAWLDTYRERKLHKKVVETLRDFGIKQNEVLDLDLQDLPHLSHPYVKDWTDTPYFEKYLDRKTGESKTRFKSLTETQIDALRKIHEGYVRVPAVSSSYFMNALKGTSVDEWERASKADRKKGAQLASGYTYRIIVMLVLSLAANGINPSPYQDNNAVALNIAMRIFVLITSVIWGIYLGFKAVELDIVFLAYKTYIVKLYGDEYESGKFKPESIQEEIDREFEEYEKERQKAIDSVIDPVVEQPVEQSVKQETEKEEPTVMMLPHKE